jgi:hypothetical protein
MFKNIVIANALLGLPIKNFIKKITSIQIFMQKKLKGKFLELTSVLYLIITYLNATFQYLRTRSKDTS